ncbi:MAG: sodium ion-translocating decarboxylase subunit beta [Ruminococcaceae bacterium]|nr:sodium ion-translocating decarboxylase subunit beta [Oscillospiraceae bacterium]
MLDSTYNSYRKGAQKELRQKRKQKREGRPIMKKLLIAVAIVLAVALLCFLAFGLSMQNKASVGIIGGADGPTAILITESIFDYFALIYAFSSVVRFIGVFVVAIILCKKGM